MLDFSSFKNRKNLLILASFTLLLIIALALISNFWPKYEMRFFELGLLGKDKKAADYFPNQDSYLSVGSQLDWFIYIHNHMGSPQNIIVKVKLLNSSMELPDNRRNQPSSYASFIEFPTSLSINQTLLVPFSWRIQDAIFQDNLISIKHLTVNNQTVTVDVSDSSSFFFRVVYELWVYNQSSQQYTFAWESEEGFSSASLQIAFKPILGIE